MTRSRPRLTVEQEPFLTVRSMNAACSSGHVIEPHRHEWHQLVYACAGAMTVYAGRFSWMIPPGKAVFIPAGCSHSIRMWGMVAVRSLYFAAWLHPPALDVTECRVLSVTPLLRELILRVVELGALDGRSTGDQSLLNVLLEEMNTAPVAPLALPLPCDARAMAAARHILDCPSSTETLDDLAVKYGAARRTLERLFRRDTGLSFGLWRQKARMLDSIRLLAEGKSVTDAALECGYASVSAFISAFRNTFGYTPGRLGSPLAAARTDSRTMPSSIPRNTM